MKMSDKIFDVVLWMTAILVWTIIGIIGFGTGGCYAPVDPLYNPASDPPPYYPKEKQ